MLSLSVIMMTMLPEDTMSLVAVRRLATWDLIKSRMPWNVIVMYGSVTSMSRVAKASAVSREVDAKGSLEISSGSLQ